MPKPKTYKMYETGRAYEGTLSLYKKTHEWVMAGDFEGEAGYYTTSGKNIELIETSRAGSEECVFNGSKGKKKIAYAGTWECYFPEYGEYISDTWEAEK